MNSTVRVNPIYGNTERKTLLPADRGQYPTPVYLRGDDIIIPCGWATAWGGPHDKGDDGGTASGRRTDRPGGIEGCSLPMPIARGCHGTPIPQLPWMTEVIVTLGGRSAILPLIDEGPTGGLDSRAIIDVTCEGWAKLLGRQVDTREVNGLGAYVSVRIPNVSRFLRDYTPMGVSKV